MPVAELSRYTCDPRLVEDGNLELVALDGEVARDHRPSDTPADRRVVERRRTPPQEPATPRCSTRFIATISVRSAIQRGWDPDAVDVAWRA
jgi:hypothetical protein